jgi:hypothetical protein
VPKLLEVKIIKMSESMSQSWVTQEMQFSRKFETLSSKMTFTKKKKKKKQRAPQYFKT